MKGFEQGKALTCYICISNQPRSCVKKKWGGEVRTRTGTPVGNFYNVPLRDNAGFDQSGSTEGKKNQLKIYSVLTEFANPLDSAGIGMEVREETRVIKGSCTDGLGRNGDGCIDEKCKQGTDEA